MQSTTIDSAPEAVRPVLTAVQEAAPTPFEQWYDAARRDGAAGALGADAIVAAFFRLNGGRDGVRWLAREGLSDVYLRQLERTLGGARAVQAFDEPQASSEPASDEASQAQTSSVSAASEAPSNPSPAEDVQDDVSPVQLSSEAVSAAAPPLDEVEQETAAAPAPSALAAPPRAPPLASTPARGRPSYVRPQVYAAGLLAGAVVGVALIMVGPDWGGGRRSSAPLPSASNAPTRPPPRLRPREDADRVSRPTPMAPTPKTPVTRTARAPHPVSPPSTAAHPKRREIVSSASGVLPKRRETASSASAARGKHIRVDMARRRVEVLDGGKVVRVLEHVSFGRTGHRTPVLTNASLSMTRRERLHRSKLYGGAPMPYSLFLDQTPNIAFHAGDTGARSHGCIHLRRGDAKWLFKWVGADPVRVDIRSA